MPFKDPNKPIISRFFATDTPPHRRIEILSTPGNSIDFYSGLAAETAAGHLNVDQSGTNSIMEVAAPQNAVTTNDALTKWTNDTTSNLSAIYNQADNFAIQARSGQTTFTDDVNGVGVWSNLDGWHAAAFNGTWTDFAAAGTEDTRYRKLASGLVILTGAFKDTGAQANPVFVLPAGYRPSQLLEFACKSNNDAGTISWVQITASGQVNAVGNVAQARIRCALSGITFLAEG